MGIAVVTGATGGLGGAIAAELGRAGMQVLAPRHDELELLDAQAVDGYFRAIDPPELLVCAAGVVRDRLLARMTADDWQTVVDGNLKTAMHCARAAAPGMLKRRVGHIIFVSSYSAIHPPAGQAAYAAAKAGLLGLTHALARELGSRNVRVNALLPGFMETRMTSGLEPQVIEAARESHVLGRFNEPSAVASFIRCLHHDMPATSGQVFSLDSRIV